MTEVLSSSSSYLRKAELQQKMQEAISLGEKKVFSVLQAQWAHRYGLATLPKAIDFEDFIDLNSTVDAVPSTQRDEFGQQTSPIKEELIIDRSNIHKSSGLRTESFDLDQSSIPSGSSTTFSSVCLEELTEKLEEETNSNLQESSQSKIQRPIAPPPPPALNHLRRWLPVIEDELPKAS